ncbi:MAG TPA: hypothetical protein VK879_09705 [Candidatus Sulfomarinibacteraceae bacterium]|nr:hypothetical protein [Candidatus Sulfomarinibacteraceae bacterium]
MSIFFTYYSGVLNDALIAGALIGAALGIIVFGAASASEGMERVIFGFLLGGLIMGLVQAFLIMSATGVGLGTSLGPMLDVGAGPVGSMVAEGVTRTVQAAFAGGLLMVISLAPVVAMKGALAGGVIGIVSGLAAWWLTGYVDVALPLIIFYMLIAGVILFVLDNLPVRG